jgi:hypothetical protein
MKKQKPYDSIKGGRIIIVHLSVILDFYQFSQDLDLSTNVAHLFMTSAQNTMRTRGAPE